MDLGGWAMVAVIAGVIGIISASIYGRDGAASFGEKLVSFVVTFFVALFLLGFFAQLIAINA